MDPIRLAPLRLRPCISARPRRAIGASLASLAHFPVPRIFPLPPLPIHTPEPHRPRTTTARARASPSTTTRCTPTSPPSRDRGRVARVPPPMLRRHPHTTHPIGTRTRTQTFGWVRALGRRRAVETCSTGHTRLDVGFPERLRAHALGIRSHQTISRTPALSSVYIAARPTSALPQRSGVCVDRQLLKVQEGIRACVSSQRGQTAGHEEGYRHQARSYGSGTSDYTAGNL
ncbi:hypothetical protein B0H14DRAFT_385059 [Mycena olivaceomarginata]|nr:hypothetical protein B0H14DRAFT_385059 [Mycena olivaceomarginata]